MPRRMNQNQPQAFRLAVRKEYAAPTAEGYTVYYGPYATAAACKGQVRNATDELNWRRDPEITLHMSIERTESQWETVEKL